MPVQEESPPNSETVNRPTTNHQVPFSKARNLKKKKQTIKQVHICVTNLSHFNVVLYMYDNIYT